MSCTTCLRERLSPLTARLLSRAPGQSAVRKSFPRTQSIVAMWASVPTLSPRRREGHALSGVEGWSTHSPTLLPKRREGWGTQVPVLSANPHRINPFRLTPLNGIFCDNRLVLNILPTHGGRGVRQRQPLVPADIWKEVPPAEAGSTLNKLRNPALKRRSTRNTTRIQNDKENTP